MKLTGLFGALLVIASPLFAATEPKSTSETCSVNTPEKLLKHTVMKCDKQPCTYQYLSGYIEGQRVS